MAAKGLVTLAGGILGGIVGFLVGGPTGAAYGFSLGAGLAAGFEPKDPIEVGRISDLQVTGASYGDPISRVYGTIAVPGSMLWSSGLIEKKDKKKEGGGLFSSGTEVTTYKYFLDVVYVLCEGPIEGIGRVWMNGILVADYRTTADALSVIGKSKYWSNLTLYKGTETQLPDPLVESYEGAGNVGADRGLVKISIERLKLARFYNKAPNLKVEVIKSTSTQSPPSVVQDLTTDRVYQQSAILDNGTILSAGLSTAGLDPDHEFDHIIRRTDLFGEVLDEITYEIRLPGTLSGAGRFEIQNEPRAAIYRNFFGGSSCRLFWEGQQIAVQDHPAGTGPLGTDDDEAYGTDEFRTVKRGNGRFYVTVTSKNTGSNGLIRYLADSFDRPTFNWDKTVRFSDLGFPVSTGTNFWLYPDAEDEDVLWLFNTSSATTDDYYLTRFNTDLEVLGQWRKEDGVPISNQISHNMLIGPGYCVQKVSNTTPTVRLWSFDHETSRSTWSVEGNVSVDNPVNWNGCVPLTPELVQTYGEIVTRGELIATGGQSLQSVVESIAADAGYSAGELDMSGLSGTVQGLRIPGPKTGRASIQDLQFSHFFDLVEIDYQLQGVMRGGSSVATIAVADMAAHREGDQIPDLIDRERAESFELPRAITVKYLDRDANYEVGSQGASRELTEANRETVVTLNVTMNAEEAVRSAHVVLYNEHAQRETLGFFLTEQLQKLVPTDLVTITDDSDQILVRLIEEQEDPRGFIRYQAVPDYPPVYTQTVPGAIASTDYAEIVDQNGPASLAWLDLPPLNDSDDNVAVYAGAGGYLDTWSGHDLYRYSEASTSYNLSFSFVERAAIGRTEGALGDHASGVVDYDNSVTVRLVNDALVLTSSTEAAVLADHTINRAAIGRAGRFEVVQFITATDLTGGRYTLSGLLRGRRSTEYGIPLHESGDEFILLDPESVVRLIYAAGDVGSTLTHKFVGQDDPIDLVLPIPLELEGHGKLPTAPANVEAVQSGTDWVISWDPRNRHGNDIQSNVASSTDDEIASYTIDFLDGSGVVQGTYGVTVGTETRTYTSAEQTTDFGSAQSDLIVAVYQKGVTLDKEGRGFQLETATDTKSIVPIRSV